MKRRLTSGSEYLLGQKIAGLFAMQRASDLPTGILLGQVQDLLGSETALLVPLRDLLQRPVFRQLLEQGGTAASQPQLLAGRDALLQDLALTYQPAVLARLAAVIDGSLGLPSMPSSSVIGGAGSGPGPARSWGQPQSQSSQLPSWSAWGSQVVSGQPAAGPAPATPSPAAAAPAPVQVTSGPSAVTALLIALVSLLSGAVLLVLGWLLFSDRPQGLTGGAAQPAPSSPPAAPSAPSPAPTPPPPATPKEPTTVEPASPSSAWGDASEYKFGQLPGGDYPNSCAFSVTDVNGRTTTDKSQVEYWACRDVGGDPETGYRVVWADGKETNYTFQSGGDGQVVGTNGSTYPMRWRNDTHQGEPIVVINHQDGAITWIPGQIN